MRDCRHCWQYQYHEEGPEQNKPREFHGELLERPPGDMPNCYRQVGCKKGTIENQNVLTEENAKVLRHYRECRAVNKFPDDPIVRHNAAIIDETERMLDRNETSMIAQSLHAATIRGVL